MKLTGLTKLVSAVPEINGLQQAPSGHIHGLLTAGKPVVMAALCEPPASLALVVVSHPHEAEDLERELSYWSERSVLLFPPTEALPYERVPVDRRVLGMRVSTAQAARAGENVTIVASVRALLQPLATSSTNAPLVTRLRTGAEIRVGEMVRSWSHGGYSATTTVTEPGTFARRGGILDIFPYNLEAPLRIDLYGPTIDSIRHFDPATQRSVSTLDEVEIQALSEVTESERHQALSVLRTLNADHMGGESRGEWEGDLDALESGVPLEDLPLFMPLVSAHTTLLGCLSGARVIVDQPNACLEVASELWEQTVALRQSGEAAGHLPLGLELPLVDPAVLKNALAEPGVIAFETGAPSHEGSIDLSNVFSAARSYSRSLHTFTSDLEAQSRQHTIVTSFQHERLAELLEEENIPVRQVQELSDPPLAGLTLLPQSVRGGWSCAAIRCHLLSDIELFGHRQTSQVGKPRRQARDAFFSDFSPGDHVVHLEHGIGRFEGVTRMTIEGAEREYALVQYHGADKVYVPVDQLERLTKYVGVGEGAPQLSRLGGAEWQRARQRAQAAAEDIAKELIELYSRRMARAGHAFEPDGPWQHELESAFPFEETPDQARAIQDVKVDMEAPRPMDRLVCADVGYGKTEVAIRAAFKAAVEGQQVAILTPTTVLAQQHYETFAERLAAFPVRVEMLSRFRSPPEQRKVLRQVTTGEVDIVIGTHRLLQKDVEFKRLGLLVVDEEQRFGVRHKERLKQLRESVDVLTLSATPIPRTLHMGLVGIREISVMETAPEGRLPIKTYLQPHDDSVLREAIVRERERDGQVYVVHNKVSTIEAVAERIRRLVPEVRVAVAHGQMEAAQLEHVMLTFAHHEADVLICSTIIENGLDIPNVNTIIVNNAHQLGLTQLYQLRGRVGRSNSQAYAYLLYPRDARLSLEARRRMEAVFEAQELGAGFGVAMRDLEIRGAGNLLGSQQSGYAAAVGFDLYTRTISEAIDRQRGIPVEEPASVTISLPLTMFLPPDYVGDDAERIVLYRRLAGITNEMERESVAIELVDRFGPLPEPVRNLLSVLNIKILALNARINSISLGPEHLTMRAQSAGIYDRLALYRRYGSEAKISTNVLRIPGSSLSKDWLSDIEAILREATELKQVAVDPTVAPAARETISSPQ